MLILRALQGVAAAAIFANTATMVAHAYADDARPRPRTPPLTLSARCCAAWRWGPFAGG
ncbi:hypothetical protein LJR290_004121 [Variovorax sp. LjRoot290]|uniref:hypothetical protein n=1 Tax=Variovorax sp. LjRoot290 TaxID=3342316 RepID=UPI003ECE19EA